MHTIDLRSDTVTHPTQEMRDAMYRAEVGDDVFGDDPTILKLEDLAARTFGKQAALFVTSGTQGNAVSIMAHTRRGDAILVGEGCHIFGHEAGAYAVLAGVSPRVVKESHGIPDLAAVKAGICDDSDLQIARTGLVCMENAHSVGRVIPLDTMRQIYEIAHARGVPVHLDGARLFNAAHVLGVGIQEMTQYCDSVMCCLSKGLCAPVGSVVAGPREFIARARKYRKMLGGGMRQAGILAAAGILALRDMPARLVEDHENARFLAKGLKQLPGVRIKNDPIQVNMVFLTADWSEDFSSALPKRMEQRGIKITGCAEGEWRMVTHKDVTRKDCVTVLENLRACVEAYG